MPLAARAEDGHSAGVCRWPSAGGWFATPCTLTQASQARARQAHSAQGHIRGGIVNSNCLRGGRECNFDPPVDFDVGNSAPGVMMRLVARSRPALSVSPARRAHGRAAPLHRMSTWQNPRDPEPTPAPDESPFAPGFPEINPRRHTPREWTPEVPREMPPQPESPSTGSPREEPPEFVPRRESPPVREPEVPVTPLPPQPGPDEPSVQMPTAFTPVGAAGALA
jgi:hypothetical protein